MSADRTQNWIKPIAYMIGDYIMPSGVATQVSCEAPIIGTDILNLTDVDVADGVTGQLRKVPAGSKWAAITDVPGQLTLTYQLNDPNKGLIWVDKSDYDTKKPSCNACCL